MEWHADIEGPAVELAELRTLLVLAAMLLLPGWAFLAVSDLWKRWQGLQRWIVAVGCSIAFYPVLFYGIRVALPFLTLGPYKITALLVACLGVIIWRMHSSWRDQFDWDALEWVALLVFGMTLFTRFWVIRDHPYPAWSDSLHHTLLTQLTAVRGQLPYDMLPEYPIYLDQYHLGLYALSATVQWLAQVPAHTALLWTAQALNGLCGLGVYLVLDRKAGRVGAIVGATIVGLLCHQPAWYVNWGRFTQIAGQTILLVAWLVTWGTMSLYRESQTWRKPAVLWGTGLAAVLSSAVFLLHFRVSAFYLVLLGLTVVIELWKARKERHVASALLGMCAIGMVTLMLCMPALLPAAAFYLGANSPSAISVGQGHDAAQVAETMRAYFGTSLNSVPFLSARPWLLVLSGLGAVLALWKRNLLGIMNVVWVLVLYLIGNAYRLSMPYISFTNLGAILIMLYLPIGVIVGAAVESVIEPVGLSQKPRLMYLASALVLFSGFIGSQVRVTEIEEYRYFVTPEDVAAMQWINQNVPSDAVFAVNTYFWLPGAFHGTDAGYWIPYFTGRKTTVGVMLNNLGTREYLSSLTEASHVVSRLASAPTAEGIARLWELGVDYIYIGKKGGNSLVDGLDLGALSKLPGVTPVYLDDGIAILQIDS